MSWRFEVELNAAVRAAIAGDKSAIVVGPPAWWAVLPMLEALPPFDTPLHTIVLAPDAVTVAEGAAVLRAAALLQPSHAATGLVRIGRLLEADAIGTLVLTPPDLERLVQRSRVNLTAVRRVIICWPEQLIALGFSSTLDEMLAEGRGMQRIVLTRDSAPLATFFERHARRAAIQVIAEPPREPQDLTIRYAVTAPRGLPGAVCEALDIADPTTALLWEPLATRRPLWAETIGDPWVRVDADPGSDPVDLAIAVDVPSPDALAALAAVCKELLVFARAPQIPYLRTLVRKMRPLRLPSEADKAHTRMASVRDDLRQRIRSGTLDAELLSLAPLFDEFDPTLVAAAVAARAGDVARAEAEAEAPVTWARIRISGGRRDRIRTGDVVGALLNAVGLAKQQLGRIEIRESFSLVEVEASALQKALVGLDGLVVRGRKLSARIDRR